MLYLIFSQSPQRRKTFEYSFFAKTEKIIDNHCKTQHYKKGARLLWHLRNQ